MTTVLEKPVGRTDTHQSPSSHGTYADITDRWADYEYGRTEERLGVVATELATVRTTGRHTVLAMDETRQPGGNFKYNGMAAVIDKAIAECPDIDTFYIGTAGNAGAALVAAVRNRRKRAVIDAPSSLVDSKRDLMTSPASTVHAEHPSVEAATAAAGQRAEADSFGKFVHAYNDLDAIAGQGMVAHRAIRGLLARHREGRLDLSKDRVTFLLQRGGGSLLTAFACAVRQLKEQGVAGDNLRVYEVRPYESIERFDGLFVKAPGSYAESILRDDTYVHDTVYVDDVDAGQAMLEARRRFGRTYEPSGIAGLAAVQQLWNSEPPTTFVTVLSGANSSPAAYEHFTQAPGRHQKKLLTDLLGRSLDELLAQPYTPGQRWQPTPHYYGRTPATK